MLTEKELLQICRGYEITCPVCSTTNNFFRLKRDMCRPTKTEGDGHPLSYRWGKQGFDSVDPKLFFFGTCQKCRLTDELDDADYRTAPSDPDRYKEQFLTDELQQLQARSSTGKGIAQSLGKKIKDSDPFGSIVAQFHLGIYCQCLRSRPSPGSIARYYLRIAWLFREQEKFYPDADLGDFTEGLDRLKSRWDRELPANKEYPVRPELALSETEALRFSRTFFERNYETLKEAKLEDELRLRYLLAEIGFRLYELTSDGEDYKKAASFFSGTMQQCLSIISDKSIVGGAVNRAREMLEKSGERGRELRELNKSRGGEGKEEEAPAVEKGVKGNKKKAKKGEKAKAGKGETGTNGAAEKRKEAREKAPETEAKLQPDLDQITRQTELLQEEVETLRQQLKDSEEDNKKWRQLAGRDTLTGLDNKNMLLRLIMPRTLKDLSKEGPLSCIAIGFDQMAQINQQHGWITGDRMLQQAVKGLRTFVSEGEQLYRLDGANFALVGPMSNNTARQRATEMRRRLAGASVQVEETQLPLVSSVGVVTVEKVVGSSLVETSNAIYQALLLMLYRAKDKGGNTVEVHSLTKF